MPIIDQVVVASLPHRYDRREVFMAGLPTPWPLPPIQMVDAVDGTRIDLPQQWRAAGPGAYGCALTHAQLVRTALNAEVQALFVMEDDATFAEDFTSDLQRFLRLVPSDWRVLMLGGQHVSPPSTVNSAVVRCWDTQRTHAYVVRDCAMADLLRLWEVGEGHIDWRFSSYQRLTPTYAPKRFLIGQTAGFSDVTRATNQLRFWND